MNKKPINWLQDITVTLSEICLVLADIKHELSEMRKENVEFITEEKYENSKTFNNNESME